ncbi:MAG: response regulator [Spirochaetales bacterium]|nr:response regulator [Spirochaetales bacterium]MCF7939685.1 response regulator [Spirochaetales bacterium]
MQEKPIHESRQGQKDPSDTGTDVFIVLVAEDSRTTRRLTRLAVEKIFSGVRILEAGTGVQAVELYRQFHPELILMDLQMPEMDGFEAARIIRSETKTKTEIRILALSASAASEERERCYEAGMNGYLAKPVSPHDLEDATYGLHSGSIEHKALSETESGKTAAKDESRSLLEKAHNHLNAQGVDKEVAGQILKSTREVLPGLLKAFEHSLRASDFSDLASASHSIRGNMLTLGLNCIAEPAAKIEECCRTVVSEPPSEKDTLYRRIETNAGEIRRLLTALITQLGGW